MRIWTMGFAILMVFLLTGCSNLFGTDPSAKTVSANGFVTGSAWPQSLANTSWTGVEDQNLYPVTLRFTADSLEITETLPPGVGAGSANFVISYFSSIPGTNVVNTVGKYRLASYRGNFPMSEVPVIDGYTHISFYFDTADRLYCWFSFVTSAAPGAAEIGDLGHSGSFARQP